jgi:CheY-like chemotaxis protein
MDVMMPEMDGLTAARIIRGMKGTDAGKIPIFAMNASAFANVVEAGRRAGMNEHLSKPSDETNMMRKIRGYITR